MPSLTAYNKFIQMALKYFWKLYVSLYGLPKTGQTIVLLTGDDGTYQKGYPGSGARFTDNGDGTITDNATGLMWVKDGDGAGCNNGNTLIWGNAVAFCNELDFAGYTDWRMPNTFELMSILNYGAQNPCIDPLFTSKSSDYWSSTSAYYFYTAAWAVNFYYGMVAQKIKEDNSYYVRPVRGG